jgi:hypothetical protein
MLLFYCENIQNTNYTLQDTVEFLHVTAGHMYFIAGPRNVKYFLSFCPLGLQNQLSAAVQKVV